METLSTFIPDEKITEVRESCSIVDVIADYVGLTKAGTSYKGLCPFHHEKTPSFFVSEAKKIFHCFGCGISGDVFTFIMKHEHVGFHEAVRLLAKRQGIPLPERQLTYQQQRRLKDREDFFYLNTLSARFYHNILCNDSRGKKARKYLEKRGINTQTIQQHQIGYAPEEWDVLLKFLKGRRASLEHAEKIGLIIAKGKGSYYDRFRGRIIFPIFNIARNIIGFGGRVLDKGEPKYLNSPESPIYNKRQNFYALHAASQSIRHKDEVLLVEGYFDVLILHQHRITNAVASLGTALTEQQIQVLKRYTQNIITVFDADVSGEKAMMRSLPVFLKNGISPRVIVLPSGHDPDSFVRQHGEGKFTELLNQSIPLVEFVLEKTIKRYNLQTTRGKIGACEEIAPILQKISNAIERDFYIQKFSQKLSVREEHLLSSIKRNFEKNSLHTTKPAKNIQTPKTLLHDDNAEKLILELMTLHPEIIPAVEKSSIINEFSCSVFKNVGTLLCKTYHKLGDIDIHIVLDSTQDEEQKRVITEILFKEDYDANLSRILEDCIQKIRLKKLKQEMDRVYTLLKDAESKHDDKLCRKFQIDWQRLLEKRKAVQQFRVKIPQG